MRVSNKLVKYVLAVCFVCVCGTAIVLMGFIFFTFGEACVVYETVCEEWVVPVSILGIILLVAAAVSGYGLFVLVSEARARTTTGKL
ncbi:MAG: hypothetical protein F4W68_05380 [Cenarchaeum sp. SB0661_bin_35]|nr:hypothetical protein [Cenarchaeum sp. SB0667_bin_13]MYC79906.1 hypothetical protein [Cenarchaeum sp. SB0661_bin_35]MYJ28243.1 hypothetical protein [Cenarchaeum sp. SB0672_bin_9]